MTGRRVVYTAWKLRARKDFHSGWTQGDGLRFLPVIQNIMQFKTMIAYINLLSDSLIFFLVVVVSQ